MLTIALDAQHTRHSSAGIARYARGLAQALRRLPEINVVELGGGPLVQRGTLRKKLLTAEHDLLWYPLLARRRARRAGAQIYHSPLLRGPVTKGKPPFVMTVHDLVPVRWPHTMPRWHRAYTTMMLPRLLASADRVIAPSQDTADDLALLLNVPAQKIRVVPNGVDPLFFERPRMPKRFAGPYVLFVGTPEPRKNLVNLIAALKRLWTRGGEEELVIVGSGGWGGGAELEHAERIHHVGRVSDEELLSLYAGASCLALPSLHEGFGLPALEAMAAGTPVVAGNAGALPEVTGGAAVLVDPNSPAAIAEGIVRSIAEKDRLVTSGRERAKLFTWERTAALTANVYRELA